MTELPDPDWKRNPECDYGKAEEWVHCVTSDCPCDMQGTEMCSYECVPDGLADTSDVCHEDNKTDLVVKGEPLD